jgi:hypothetical protein
VRLFPLRFGGGYDEYQKAFRVLKSAEGIGGSAASDYGIDGLWRRSRALSLVCATSAYRRAINNGWPQSCTDMLPYYERCLGIVPAPDATEADRRDMVVSQWPAKASSIQRDILARLQRVDSRFAIIQVDDSVSHVSHDGSSFGTWGCSQMAFFTTRYILRVSFPVGHTPLTNVELAQIDQAKRVLRDSLPSFWDFTITTSSRFLCGVSPLGLTGTTN